MMDDLQDVSRLREAYQFYQKAKQNEDSIACGCLNDAYEWLFSELKALFDEEEE